MYEDSTVSTTAEFYLRYYATEASSLDHTYDLISHAVSGTWEEGTGKLSDNPMKNDGVSWKNYDGRHQIYTWSMHNPTLASSASQGSSIGRPTSGGGIFFTGSGFYGTQSFSYTSPDTEIRVTDVVGKWLRGSSGQTWPSGIPNNGFITMWSGSQESSSFSMGDLKFFSSNTHTIYPPKLEVKWDDVNTCTGDNTGSMPQITSSGLVDNYVYPIGLKESLFIVAVFHIFVLSYIKNLERIHCDCSKHWQRDFIKYYSLVAIVISTSLFITGISGSDGRLPAILSSLLAFAGLINAFIVFFYTKKLISGMRV